MSELVLSGEAAESLRKYLLEAMLQVDIAENVAPHLFDYTGNARAHLRDALSMLEPGEDGAAVAEPEPEPAPSQPARGAKPCHAPRHTRRLHAICSNYGVDFNGDALRALASHVCGRTITSKGQMRPDEWERVGNVVEARRGVGEMALAGGAR